MADGEYRVLTQSMVTLNVTTTLSSFPLERRFNKGISVANLKGRLELLTGASPVSMRLQLFSKNNGASVVSELNDDEAPLGFYPVEDGMTLHVIDEVTSAKAKSADDSISNDPIFALTNEEYAKRNDTVKAYLVRNKLGKYAGSNGDSTAVEKDVVQPSDVLATNLTVGSRCVVTIQGQLTKRGEIKFVGKTHCKPGVWVGVAYDEPVGKNNGSMDGQRYFECEPKYGAFVRPMFVTVGDFPEEDVNIDEM